MGNKYYVYFHIKETTGEVFYVGKGMGNRAYSKNKRNNFWTNIVNKYGYDVIIIKDNLTNEESFKLEEYWVNRIGRRDLGLGPLVNLKDGGIGPNNFSDETKKKISDSLKGRKQPTEVVEQRAKSNTGKKRTQAHKDKMSAMFKGRTHSDEYKEACRQRQLGVPSHRKGKSKYASEEEKKEANRERSRQYKAKLKQIRNENKRKGN